MSKTAIIYSPIYLEHDPGPDHPESPSRLKAIMDGVEKVGLLKAKNCSIVDPRKATVEEIGLVRDRSYIKMIKSICEQGGGVVDSDTTLSPKSYEAAMFAAGGILGACESILLGKFSNAFACVRPPGHHVGFNGRALGVSSQGFCVFNNVAIAAANLMKKHGLKRIMILDIDAHHGNGTQELFNRTPNVLYVSIHQDGRTLYPGTGFIDEIGEGEGEGSKVNIPLPQFSGDDAHLKALNQIVVPIADDFKPEIILISVGFDAHHTDPVANLKLSSFEYLKTFEIALSLASNLCSGKLAATLEGGYSLETVSKLAPAIIGKMAGISIPITDKKPTRPPSATQQADKVINQVKNTLSPYWKL